MKTNGMGPRSVIKSTDNKLKRAPIQEKTAKKIKETQKLPKTSSTGILSSSGFKSLNESAMLRLKENLGNYLPQMQSHSFKEVDFNSEKFSEALQVNKDKPSNLVFASKITLPENKAFENENIEDLVSKGMALIDNETSQEEFINTTTGNISQPEWQYTPELAKELMQEIISNDSISGNLLMLNTANEEIIYIDKDQEKVFTANRQNLNAE